MACLDFLYKFSGVQEWLKIVMSDGQYVVPRETVFI